MVGSGVLFGSPDTSAVRLSGGRLIDSNQAIGAAGGQGGNGGDGLGGGIAGVAGSTNIFGCTIDANQASGGEGYNGGNGWGGGLYNQGTAVLIDSTINGNKAKGGAGSGGLNGTGQGGGVFNLGPISIDALTAIFGNEADLFADCFDC